MDSVNLLSVGKGWRTPRYNDFPICFPNCILYMYFMQLPGCTNSPYPAWRYFICWIINVKDVAFGALHP